MKMSETRLTDLRENDVVDAECKCGRTDLLTRSMLKQMGVKPEAAGARRATAASAAANAGWCLYQSVGRSNWTKYRRRRAPSSPRRALFFDWARRGDFCLNHPGAALLLQSGGVLGIEQDLVCGPSAPFPTVGRAGTFKQGSFTKIGARRKARPLKLSDWFRCREHFSRS
jgi:hypothetical protein